MNAPAPAGGFAISLTYDQSYAQVPASVTVSAGQKTATLSITTSPVTAAVTATITGTDSNKKASSAKLRVVSLRLVGLGLSSEDIKGGKAATGTVYLNGSAPACGVVVTLASDQAFVQVPDSVTIPAGSKAVTFAISTSAVTSRSHAKVTANDPSGNKETAGVTVHV